MVAVQKFLDNGKDVFACNTDISLGFVICHIVYFRFFIVFSIVSCPDKKNARPFMSDILSVCLYATPIVLHAFLISCVILSVA